MEVEFEIYLDGEWHVAASARIHDPERGYLGPVTVDYDFAYFGEFAAIDYAKGEAARDIRALSVRMPVDLASCHYERWPSFLLDLMPQGHARRQLAMAMGLDERSRAADLPLLLRAGGNVVGNIRVAQAWRAEYERLSEVMPAGVSWDEIVGRSERFVEVFDRFMMIASGSSGLQGEWPKVAMTLAADGLYYPDPQVPDDQARDHIIVKLLRSDKATDRDILRLEGLYSTVAQHLGLNVHRASTYAPGVLIIPRFDRAVAGDGQTIRYGQESMVSALGVAEFGYVGNHEGYIDVIRRYSSEPMTDIFEYVRRDVANLAMGNTDNHGRNTALRKHADGGVRLAPLFDFAPMQLADETVVRSTRWGCMRGRGGDTLPDWQVVCDTIFPDDAESAEGLLMELKEFAVKLEEVPNILAADTEDIEPSVARAISRCEDIRRSLIDTDCSLRLR